MRRNTALSTVSAYKPDQDMSIPERLAHFVDFAAKHAPGNLYGPHVVAKFIVGYARVPNIHSKETDSVRDKISKAKVILREVYGRELISVPNQGIRGSINETEKAKYAYARCVRRVQSALVAAKVTREGIDISQIADTAEGKALKAWMRGSTNEVLKLAEKLVDIEVPGLKPLKSTGK